MIRARFTVLLTLVFGLTSPAVPAQPIKLGTLAPEGSPWHTIIRDMGESWKKATGEKVYFRIYAGGVAGDEPDMVRKMRIGQLHAVTFTGVGLTAIAPEVQALQMPMMLSSYDELDYVRDRIAPKLESILEAKGFKVLNWGDAGWVRFFSQKPVVRPEDLKPLRLFVWNSDAAYIGAWKDAGYHPIPLAATEIHTALESGLINAFATTPAAALSFQWFGLAKHMTDLHWAPLVGATVISETKWKEMPDEAKPRLVKAARDAGARFKKEARRFGEEAVRVMRDHGLQVHQVPTDLIPEWEKAARAGYSKLVGQVVPADMVAEVEKLRNEYRASKKDG